MRTGYGKQHKGKLKLKMIKKALAASKKAQEAFKLLYERLEKR